MQQASSHKEWFFLLQVQCVSSFLSTWFWSLQKNGPEQAQKPKACTSRWNTFCWPCNGPPKKKIRHGERDSTKRRDFSMRPPRGSCCFFSLLPFKDPSHPWPPPGRSSGTSRGAAPRAAGSDPRGGPPPWATRRCRSSCRGWNSSSPVVIDTSGTYEKT